MKPTRTALVPLLTLLALAACGSEGSSVASAAEADQAATPGSADPLPVAQAARPKAAAISDSVDASRRTAIVRAAARVAPAVVNVAVIGSEPATINDPWASFFGFGGSTRRRTAGFGSGVIIRKDGVIVTNNHVVRDADKIKVTLPDGRDFDAELVGTDPVADIAVLRIHGDSLPVAPVGSSKGLLIGEWVVAIGNPFANYFSGAEPSVTAGVVSATNRNIVPSSSRSADDEGFYLGMIQTDAAINPGNSGGPLVDALGQVVGINASIVSRSGGSEGLGFAIPIDRAIRTANDLLKYGRVRRAWVGLHVKAAEADAWGRSRGVLVSSVAPGSPASEAHIEVGDRLLAANGRPLTGPLDFEAVLLDLRSGDGLDLNIEGDAGPVHMKAAALPSVSAPRVTVLKDIQLVTVTPQIQGERGLQSDSGALITSISGELSAQLGLSQGDVLLQINGTRIRTAQDAARIFDNLRGSGQVRIYFEHNGGIVVRDFFWRS